MHTLTTLPDLLPLKLWVLVATHKYNPIYIKKISQSFSSQVEHIEMVKGINTK